MVCHTGADHPILKSESSPVNKIHIWTAAKLMVPAAGGSQLQPRRTHLLRQGTHQPAKQAVRRIPAPAKSPPRKTQRRRQAPPDVGSAVVSSAAACGDALALTGRGPVAAGSD